MGYHRRSGFWPAFFTYTLLLLVGGGPVLFSSAQGYEPAVENAAWRNGAFTEDFLAGFDGKADLTNDGTIATAELIAYVSEEVKKLTGGQQKPVLQKPNAVPDSGIYAVK